MLLGHQALLAWGCAQYRAVSQSRASMRSWVLNKFKQKFDLFLPKLAMPVHPFLHVLTPIIGSILPSSGILARYQLMLRQSRLAEPVRYASFHRRPRYSGRVLEKVNRLFPRRCVRCSRSLTCGERLVSCSIYIAIAFAGQRYWQAVGEVDLPEAR